MTYRYNFTLFTRVCSQSSQPNECTREMNERQERLGEFVVTRGVRLKCLRRAKKRSTRMASAIEMPIELARCEAMGSGRNDGFGTRGLDGGHEMVGVVALIGHHGLTRQMLDQCRSVVDIGDLPGREDDAKRIAQRIDGHMQLGCQSAARTADFLTARFFGAPAECWWARTMVESMNNCSMSASLPSTSASRSQTPLSRQRAKRTYVYASYRNSCGRSRQGLPVRKIQRAASTKTRLSLVVQPGSLALPGKRCSMRSHGALRNIFRFILTQSKSQDMTIFQPL